MLFSNKGYGDDSSGEHALTHVSKFLMRTFFFIGKAKRKPNEKKSHQCIIPFAEIPFPFDRTRAHPHIQTNV